MTNDKYGTLIHEEQELVLALKGASITVIDAVRIMGVGNSHGVNKALKYMGVTMSTAKKKQVFGRMPFSAAVLEEHKNTHILVACAGISLMEVWQAQMSLFKTKSDPWYKKDQSFAHVTATPGWYLVRKTPVPNSTSKIWSEQLTLFTDIDEVPSASVLAQAILVHYLESGERFFEAVYVRVSDVTIDGVRVSLGNFNQNGLCVNSRKQPQGRQRYSFLGASASRKFK